MKLQALCLVRDLGVQRGVLGERAGQEERRPFRERTALHRVAGRVLLVEGSGQHVFFRDIEGEELEFQLAAQPFRVRGQLVLFEASQGGRHGESGVRAGEREDAGASYAVGVCVEFCARCHLVTVV